MRHAYPYFLALRYYATTSCLTSDTRTCSFWYISIIFRSCYLVNTHFSLWSHTLAVFKSWIPWNLLRLRFRSFFSKRFLRCPFTDILETCERDTRIEFNRRHSCLSRQPLWFTALCMGSTIWLQCRADNLLELPALIQPGFANLDLLYSGLA